MMQHIIENESLSPETIWEIIQNHQGKFSDLTETLEEELQKIANGLQSTDSSFFEEDIKKIRATVTALSKMNLQEIHQQLEEIQAAFSTTFD